MTHHLEELGAELGGRIGFVRLERGNERKHVRVAARDALTDDHEGSCHNVSALDSDSHWHRHPRVTYEVGLATADARAAKDVHPVLHHFAPALGARLLHDGGEHHRRLVVVDDGVRKLDARQHGVSLAATAAERLLDATKFGDRHLELFADARIGSHTRDDALSRTDGAGRQRDAASFGKRLNHHVPAKAAALLPTENGGHWDPHVVTLDSAIHEGTIEWHMPRPHAEAFVAAL
mmetsp:Transcript_27217/g.82621  ORF Transcript_27217/g.82621 Transcript_27217/m.82621 type:complete len:234 (+) Transcript_27217:1405-2106(+)